MLTTTYVTINIEFVVISKKKKINIEFVVGSYLFIEGITFREMLAHFVLAKMLAHVSIP